MLNATTLLPKIKPQLDEAEAFRLNLRKNLRPYKFFVYATGIGTAVLFFYGSGLFSIALLIIGGITYAIKRFNNSKKLKKYFQENVVSRIFEGMGEDLTYEGEGNIPQETLRDSGLFSDFNRYECEDLVSGSINGKAFTYAEITLKKHTNSSSSSSSSSTKEIFSGVFFIRELSANIPANIFILPAREAKIMEKLSKWIPMAGKRFGDRVSLNNEAFENTYYVYSENPEIAIRLLPQPIMERLLAANKNFKDNGITSSDLKFSFSGNHIHVAIPTKSDHRFMEPSLKEELNTPEFLDKQLMIMNSVHEVAEIF